jgi:hypothetical protein
MNTLPQIFALSKPTGTNRIPDAVKGYVGQKLRNDLYNLVLDAFQKSGISQSELAARLGKDPAVINRCLSASGNWTIDTVSGLLFAINGNIVEALQRDPNSGVRSNYDRPYWLSESNAIVVGGQRTPTAATANADFRKRPFGAKNRSSLYDPSRSAFPAAVGGAGFSIGGGQRQ